ncbi:MAG: DUF1614 domain-containing protein [Sideroxydans sp.]|nr:DUF1614 domain-containing protein [Sideroxydans sp.]
MPKLPLRIFFLVAAFTFFVTFIQLGMLTIALDKLGLSANSASLLFITILVGSMLNLPLFSMNAGPPRPTDATPPAVSGLIEQAPFTGKTQILVNVGGCVVPVAFCIYLLNHNPIDDTSLLLGITTVTALSYSSSRRLPGIGIGIPILLAPVAAALIAILLDPEHAAPLAYVSGTLGVLIGADLLHLREIREMGVPLASIGGAGSFDGIFITGIIAVLLA